MTAALQPLLSVPDAVVMARSTDEVMFVVRHCAEAGVPVIPYGAGTSLEGHLAAVRGGISVDLSQMDRVLRVSARGHGLHRSGRHHARGAEHASARSGTVLSH